MRNDLHIRLGRVPLQVRLLETLTVNPDFPLRAYPLRDQCRRFGIFRLSEESKKPSPRDLKPFVYTKLRTNDAKAGTAIRLLEVLRGLNEAPLRCRIHHTDLSSLPQYETLSYRWGDKTDVETIECDSQNLNIPKTLAAALRGVRHYDRSRLVWADAACINQKDLREKEQQVRLMRRIYSQSQRTLIWLSDQPNLKISWTAWIPITFSLAWFRRRVDAHLVPQLRIHHYRKNTSSIVSPLSSAGYFAYVNILRNPWFQRAWVVQEVAVANNPTIIWNGSEISWANVVNGLQFISKLNFGLAFMPTLQHIFSIDRERQRYHRSKDDLLHILQRHQRCSATDDRDKVFAFTGLADDRSADLVISYSKPVKQIYEDFARLALHKSKSLTLLSQPAAIERPASELPSWVPDWSRVRSSGMSHSWGLEALALASKFSCSDKLSRVPFAAAPATAVAPKITTDGKLQAEGMILDTISGVADTFEGVELPAPASNLRGVVMGWTKSSRSYVAAQRVMMSWEELAGARVPASTYAPTREPILDAYWKTVSAGDYPHVPSVQIEAGIWNRVNRMAWKMRRYKLDRAMTLPYSIMLAVWQVITKGPAFKFHLQSHYTLHRRLATTKNGYLALVFDGIRAGDVVGLLRGSNVPLILRTTGVAGEWTLVGDAYVHGIMFGEAWNENTVETLTIC